MLEPRQVSWKEGSIGRSYTLVVWENKVGPIVGGREQTGIPKVYANIEDLHILGPHYATKISYEGNTFLNMTSKLVEILLK